MKIQRLLLPLFFGMVIAITLLLGAGWQANGTAKAAAPVQTEAQVAIRYVATTGSDTTDCTNSAAPCATVQYAVDQADAGDEIRVAAGEYTDVHGHVEHDPYPPNETLTQTVFISQPLTLRGGYTLTNWTVSDPIANPTTINPQEQGRGVTVMSTNQVLVENLRLVNGIASGYSLGGGIIVAFSKVTINDCWIEGNDGSGVGIYLSTVNLHGNMITNNTSSGGGGIEVYGDVVTLTQNTVSGNQGSYGGGINIEYSDVVLSQNLISDNTGSAWGGGIWLAYNTETLIMSNTIVNNSSDDNGGGLIVGLTTGSDVIIGNTFIGNTNMGGFGGGACIFGQDVTFNNNVVSDNFGMYRGGGVYIASETAILYNNEIRENVSGFDGGGVTVVVYGENQISLNGNSIINNTASSQGGGVFIETGSGGSANLVNNVIADNDIPQPGLYQSGSGVFLYGTATLLHNTISNNQGGNGSGISLPWEGTINMIDNVLISHTVGISVSANSTANLNATLWGNDTDWMGNGTITTGTINIWGNPDFIDPANGDYHLDFDSAAIDAGIDAGATTDLDGDPRPLGAGFDIGADEFIAIFLPIGMVQLQGRTDHSGALITAWSNGTAVATDATDISGTYVLAVPDGVYTITIEMPLYLDAVKTNILIHNASSIPLALVTLKGGDANDSDKINIMDLAFMGARYGLICADPTWDERADINNDCTINILDLTLAAGNFSKTSPVLWE